MPASHRFGGAQHPVRQRQFLGAAKPDQPGQEPGRTAVRREAAGGIGHGEPRAFARKDDIARQRKRHAAPGSHAIDRDDDRSVHPVHHRNRGMEAGRHLRQHGGHPVAGLQEEFEVAAGAEHLAGARQQHRPHGPVLVAVDHDAVERPDEIEVEGVGGVGTVERYVRKAVAHLVEDRVCGHRAATPPAGRSNRWSGVPQDPHAPSRHRPAHRSGSPRS